MHKSLPALFSVWQGLALNSSWLAAAWHLSRVPALRLGDSWPLCVAADSQPGTNVCWAGTGWSGLREAALPFLKGCFPQGQHASAAVSSPLSPWEAPGLLLGSLLRFWMGVRAAGGKIPWLIQGFVVTARAGGSLARLKSLRRLRVQVTVVSFGSPCALWEEGVGWCRAWETCSAARDA